MATGDDQGRLADNIVYFARALRHAGLRVGPASTADAIAAVRAGGLGSREDFYWTLHSVLVKRREDRAVFDETFRLFWKSRELVEKMLAMFSPTAPGNREKMQKRAAESRAEAALFQGHTQARPPGEQLEIDVDARLSVSDRDVLRDKDFGQMTAEELRAAQAAIAALKLPLDTVATRRFRPDPRGARLDARATLRQSLRHGGGLMLPRFKTPRHRHPPLVLLADISGSMSQYSRLFVHFMHALAEQRRDVHSFVFGTRLTNLTRALARRDPDEALARASQQVADWSGGTRIGAALGVFNRQWSRRVLGQGAVVILMTDGLERDDTTELAREADRLHRSCRRLIWLNPLLRFDGFEARARGVRTLLAHVDEFRPAHSLGALDALCDALSASSAGDRFSPRRYLHPG